MTNGNRKQAITKKIQETEEDKKQEVEFLSKDECDTNIVEKRKKIFFFKSVKQKNTVTCASV